MNRFKNAFEPDFLKTIIRTAFPIAMQFFLASAVNLIDVVMIGSLGDAAVAASGGANQIFFLLNLMLFGINSGASVFLSQFWGTRDLRNVRRTMGMMYLLGSVAVTLFTLGAVLVPQFLVGFYVHEEPALSLGASYLRIVGISYPVTALSMILSMVCRCTGDVSLPTRASMLSIGLNVGGNALLIFGLCGFPALGLNGAAIATAIARAAECLFLVIAVYRRKLPGAASLRELFAFDRNFVTKYIKTAWPVLLNEILWSTGISLYSVAYGMLGTAALAAVQISNTAIQLVTVFTRGLSNACGIYIGRTVGAGDREKAIDYGYRFSILLPATGMVTCLVMIVVHPLILTLYQVTPETLALAKTLLILQSLQMILKSDSMVLVVGIFRAAGDTLFACLLDTGSVWLVGVPMAFLGVKLGLPLWGLSMLIFLDDIAKVTVGFIHLFKEKWVKNVTAQVQEG
ncbi:MAG: MATE family efflux transporter [Clostridia bacterium]|nr:MATE family efflux transporter [Clostridia bacterium]